MTITAQTSKTGPYNGNGTTTVFSYTFKVQDEAHLVVTLADASGVETVQILNADYTVSGVGDAGGGQITMSTAPASGYTLMISRTIPLTQEVDLGNRRSVAPEVLETAYDKLTQIAQDFNEQLGRSLKVDVSTADPADLPPIDRAGQFLAFDGAGNPTYASGTGADGALRADLASSDAGKGAALVAYGSGTVTDVLDDLSTLLGADILVNGVTDLSGLTYADAPAGKTVYAKAENLLFEVLASGAANAPYDFTDTGGVKLTFVDGIQRGFSAGVKETAINEQDAIDMAADISDMVGYADHAGTTGGAGYSIYWVRNAYSADTEGSLRRAVAQATAAGGGIVLFHPRGFFNINLTEQIEIPDNVTIDAPGRNARIWAPYDVTRFKVVGSNVIIRRLSFGATANPATAAERDALWIEPSLADKVWVDQCSFTWAGDGCIDIATLVELTSNCRITISKCQFSTHDRAALIGSLVCYQLAGRPTWCPTALDDQTIRLFVTMTGNYFHCVGQRQPKVVAQAFVDSVNNVVRMAPFERDDGTTGACYGIFSAQGGCVRSRGDLFLAATGSGYAGVDASTNTYVPPSSGVLAIEGQGASEVVGSVAANSITMTDRETSYIPTPPYTITPASITDTPAGRRAFLEQTQAAAGASADNVSEGTFRWDGSSTLHPNTLTQISETNGDGRWLRIDRWNSIPDYSEIVTQDPPVIYPLGSNLIVASAEITVPATGVYFSVDTEGAAATDDLETINGGVDGRMIILRSYLTAQAVTIKHNIGNIRMAGGDFTFTNTTNRITLMFDASLGVSGFWYEISRA